MSATTVRLRPDIEKELEDLATRSRRTKSWLINEAVGDYLVQHKTRQVRWEQTVEAMESVAKGNVVSGEAAHAWLKSWGDADESPAPKVGE